MKPDPDPMAAATAQAPAKRKRRDRQHKIRIKKEEDGSPLPPPSRHMDEERQARLKRKSREKRKRRRDRKKQAREDSGIAATSRADKPSTEKQDPRNGGAPFPSTDIIEETQDAQKASSLSPRLPNPNPPHSPTNRPTTPQPISKLHTDNLTITPLRRKSPQLEAITTSSSPTHLKAATSLLSLLGTRVSRLQSQLFAFETQLQNVRNALMPTTGNAPAEDLREELTRRREGLEEILLLVTAHLNEVLVMQYALRDVVDEEGREGVVRGVAEVWKDFGVVRRVFEERLAEGMAKVSKDAVKRGFVRHMAVEYFAEIKAKASQEGAEPMVENRATTGVPAAWSDHAGMYYNFTNMKLIEE
ncbi:hypothetical protein CC80DRAFT_578285 [Byssothecium circinans]|uniref:Uncharacterized protein n=1 Tax=Byssothecium circinans TaxID=147558 RepID=A0A6A5TF41_9PLEO|nr:hypothetical protein CC80DRAFT_578285 [Byssothecium circinans]